MACKSSNGKYFLSTDIDEEIMKMGSITDYKKEKENKVKGKVSLKDYLTFTVSFIVITDYTEPLH